MTSMNVGELHATLELDDRLTRKLERTHREFKATGRSMNAEAKLGLDTEAFDENLAGAKKDAKDTAEDISRMRPEMDGSGVTNSITSGLGSGSGKLAIAGGVAGGAIMEGLTSVVSGGVDLFIGEVDKAFTRQSDRAALGASLLLPPEMSAELGRQAGEVWAQGWGENEDEVGRAMRGIILNIGGLGDMSETEFQGMTVKALGLANVMGIDVVAATRSVGSMIKNGMAKDANEGFDILAAGLAGVDESLQGEALETLDEYGANFRDLGLTGSQAFGVITASVAAGGRNLDLAADTLRTFHDQLIEGTPETVQALNDIGLNGQDMVTKIREGGPGATQALSDIQVALNGTADPDLRNRVGAQLFGTQWFDNGANATLAMDPLKTGLGDVAGKSDEVVTALDTQGAQWEAVKRQMQENFTDYMTNTLFPKFGEFNTWVLGMKDALVDLGHWGIDPIIGSLQTLFGWVGDVIEKFEDFTNRFSGSGSGILNTALRIAGVNPDIFADGGGIVPGPVGSSQLVMAHGGETIVPTHKMSAADAFASGFGGQTGMGAVRGSGGGAGGYRPRRPTIAPDRKAQQLAVVLDGRAIGAATIPRDRAYR